MSKNKQPRKEVANNVDDNENESKKKESVKSAQTIGDKKLQREQEKRRKEDEEIAKIHAAKKLEAKKKTKPDKKKGQGLKKDKRALKPDACITAQSSNNEQSLPTKMPIKDDSTLSKDISEDDNPTIEFKSEKNYNSKTVNASSGDEHCDSRHEKSPSEHNWDNPDSKKWEENYSNRQQYWSADTHRNFETYQRKSDKYGDRHNRNNAQPYSKRPEENYPNRRYNRSDDRDDRNNAQEQRYYDRYENNNRAFSEFKDLLKKKQIKSDNIEEIEGDLFSAPKEYSLAHCVAEDMSMGAGIALEFRRQFGSVGELLTQEISTGGVAILQRKDRFIYYLVTKERSNGKPSLYTLWLSIQEMKKHMKSNNVSNLALPQIGCGLDRLDWNEVKKMLEYIFQDISIKISVYSLQNSGADPGNKSGKKTKKGFVTHVLHPLIDIESGTGFLYFGTEDGYFPEDMNDLNNKYSGLREQYLRAQNKEIGQIVRTVIKDEIFYGLIVKKTSADKITFLNLEKCCKMLKPCVRKDKYYYLGIQANLEGIDVVYLDKMLNVMQSILVDCDIYVCWPQKLKNYAPNYKH